MNNRLTSGLIAVAFGAGTATGLGVAPDATVDPLGGWHYASTPIHICTARDGEGAARVVVNPEIVTALGTRVRTTQFRVTATEWWACHAVAMAVAGSSDYPARDVCYTRTANGVIIDVE